MSDSAPRPAREVFSADIVDNGPDDRPLLRRVAANVVSLLVDQSLGTGGHAVAIRLLESPADPWIELGPATRREAGSLLKGVRKDLATLSASEFEQKYRHRHEPTPPWSL